jgi:hypothetical protein
VDYPGIDGFLGTRASIMLDVIFVAMAAVVPLLGWSIWQVKVRRRYALHKRIQLTLGASLAVAILLFEVDMRLLSGWRQRAEPSPYYAAVESAGPLWDAICLKLAGMDHVPGAVFRALAIHLLFAVSTAILWTGTTVRACQQFPSPPAPHQYSRVHRRLGWLAAIDLTLTSITGWAFYWLAFVA